MRGTRPRLAVFFPPAFSAPTVLPDPRPSDSPIPQSPVPNDPACPARQHPGHTVSPCSASRPEPLGSPAPSSARFIRNEKSFIRIRYRPKRITFTFVKQTQSGTTMKTKPSAIKSLLAAALAASCLASYAAAPQKREMKFEKLRKEFADPPRAFRPAPCGSGTRGSPAPTSTGCWATSRRRASAAPSSTRGRGWSPNTSPTNGSTFINTVWKRGKNWGSTSGSTTKTPTRAASQADMFLHRCPNPTTRARGSRSPKPHCPRPMRENTSSA